MLEALTHPILSPDRTHLYKIAQSLLQTHKTAGLRSRIMKLVSLKNGSEYPKLDVSHDQSPKSENKTSLHTPIAFQVRGLVII